jgi:hypothetical protein
MTGGPRRPKNGGTTRQILPVRDRTRAPPRALETRLCKRDPGSRSFNAAHPRAAVNGGPARRIGPGALEFRLSPAGQAGANWRLSAVAALPM